MQQGELKTVLDADTGTVLKENFLPILNDTSSVHTEMLMDLRARTHLKLKNIDVSSAI